MQEYFNFLVSLCSGGGWFGYDLVGNPEDRIFSIVLFAFLVCESSKEFGKTDPSKHLMITSSI